MLWQKNKMIHLETTFAYKWNQSKEKEKNEGGIIITGNKGHFSASALTTPAGILWRIVIQFTYPVNSKLESFSSSYYFLVMDTMSLNRDQWYLLLRRLTAQRKN